MNWRSTNSSFYTDKRCKQCGNRYAAFDGEYLAKGKTREWYCHNCLRRKKKNERQESESTT